MKKILSLIFLLPVFVFAQQNYTQSAKDIFTQANQQYTSGNANQALNLYKQCINLEPKFAEAYLNISAINFEQANYDKALTNSQTALKHNKVQPAIYAQIGKAYYMLNNYDSSAYYLKMASVFGDSSEENKLVLAKSLNHKADYNGAITVINQTKNKNDQSLITRGNAYFGLGQYENAQKDYEKALQLNPNNTEANKNLANVYFANNNSEKALTYITKGISTAKGKDKVSYLLLQGNYYHKQKDYEKATESFNNALSLSPSNALVLTNQAAVLIDQSKFELAVEKCTQAINNNPSLSEAYYNRGIANEMLRKTEEACQDWEEAFILGAAKAEDFLNSPTCNE